IFSSKMAITLDVHSGFGAQDRFWFPYATSHKPFPQLPETLALKRLFDESYPHHFYRFEPMSAEYTIHGDLWDYLFKKHQEEKRAGVFLPYTLEMGSWLWLKKNPLQIF